MILTGKFMFFKGFYIIIIVQLVAFVAAVPEPCVVDVL